MIFLRPILIRCKFSENLLQYNEILLSIKPTDLTCRSKCSSNYLFKCIFQRFTIFYWLKNPVTFNWGNCHFGCQALLYSNDLFTSARKSLVLIRPPQLSKLIFVLNAAGNLTNHGLFSYAEISIVQALYNTQISFIQSNSNILEN